MNRTVDLPEMKAGELVSYELDQAFFALYNRKLAGTQVDVYKRQDDDTIRTTGTIDGCS